MGHIKYFLLICILLHICLETHAWCSSNSDCGDGLSCILGVCQRIQLTKNDRNISTKGNRKVIDLELTFKAKGWCLCCLISRRGCGCNCRTTTVTARVTNQTTTPTTTPTATVTSTASSTATSTPTSTFTTSPVTSPTSTGSSTPTSTATSTVTTSPVTTVTSTPTSTPTSTVTTSPVTSPTSTASSTPTSSPTSTVTTSPVTTVTSTPTSTPTSTATTDKCKYFFYDLIILIDESASIEQRGFEQSIEFVKRVVDNLPVGPNEVNVAVITFSYNATVTFGFDYPQSEAAINARLDNETYDDSWTNIDDALDQSIKLLINRERCVARAMIILTDGIQQVYGGPKNYHGICADGGVYGPPDTQYNCPPDPARKAAVLRNVYNVNIFGVPVGMPDTAELLRITNDSARIFPVADYSVLVEGVEKLIRMICLDMDVVTCPPPTECVPEPILDLVWVVDVSGSIDSATIASVKSFMVDFYTNSIILPSAWANEKSRSAWIVFNETATVLQNFLTTDQNVNNYVTNIIPEFTSGGGGGDCLNELGPFCARTDIEDGIMAALSLLIQQARCGVKQMIAVLTDGLHNEGHAQPLDAVLALRQLNALNELDVTTVVVGLVNPVDPETLGSQIAITADPSRTVQITQPERFAQLVNDTAIHICGPDGDYCEGQTEPPKKHKCQGVAFRAEFNDVSFFGGNKYCYTVQTTLYCDMKFGDVLVVDAGGWSNNTDGERGLCDRPNESCSSVFFAKIERLEEQPCDRGKIVIRCEDDGKASFYYNGAAYSGADGYFRISC